MMNTAMQPTFTDSNPNAQLSNSPHITILHPPTGATDRQNILLICDKSVTTQNLTFASSWYRKKRLQMRFNLLTPNVNYSGRTAPLTSKVAFYIFIQQI